MSYVFSSNFKDDIRELIMQKQTIGFSYKKAHYRLAEFDRFCIDHFPSESKLTREIAMQWAQLRPGEHINNLRVRITYIRQLALYMISIGKEAYLIPHGLTKKGIRYVPHIFTKSELRAFFAAIDDCDYNRISPARHLVLPVFFRVLYCCGLRPSEATNLKMEEVNLKTGVMTIRQSKGNKDRLVMLSPDVLNLCRIYNDRVSCIFPWRSCFFPNNKGEHYLASTFDKIFHQFWDKAGLGRNTSGNPPRLYDFRHSFCVNRLNTWVKQGKDINALMPYLSVFLGHRSFSKTDYYLHLIPEFFPELVRISEQRCASLIPEVKI